MVMNMIIRIKEKGFSVELKKQNVVNMTCVKQQVIDAILGPKIGSIVGTELGIELGLLVSLGEEHEYRPGLELQRNFEIELR